jgi:hypothetical protein
LPSDNFNRILLVAVEETLASLGDSPKQAIFFHLETRFKVRKEHIPESLTEFANALEGIFGFGASYLEKLIIKRLYEKLGLEFENGKDWDFLTSVSKVQKHVIHKGECNLK